MRHKRIDEHALGVLEFDTIREILCGFAASDLGRKAAAELTPSTDPDWIAQRTAETSELKGIIERQIRVPLAGLGDVQAVVAQSADGTVLEPGPLLAVTTTLQAATNLKRFFAELELEIPHLKALAQRLGDFEEILEELQRCIGGDETVKDEASEKLRQLRSRIESLRAKIQEKFRTIVRGANLREAIENENLLIRNGRPVVAVKTNYRAWVPGVILDRSNSGATLYVEPEALAELSEELEEAVYEEHKEVGRILWELTRLIGRRREDIKQTVKVLGFLDLTYAKARFSIMHRMSAAAPAEDGEVRLRDARHPILVELAAAKQDGARQLGDGVRDVVPITVGLGESYRMLLVTGPNTGGKTVTLKTVGLAALMSQSGMHIAAAENSRMPVFRRVYADIGDEQSLQQSLSTFSAHLAQMGPILRGASEHTLVLLDELGAGTDPAEGAALGEAILESLLDSGTLVMATSHLGALKDFAYTREGAENASVDFDAETFRPTYHLRVGEPGASNALNIAKRLGMPAGVVKRARQLLSSEDTEQQALMATVQRMRQAAEQQRTKAEDKHAQAGQLKRDAQVALQQAQKERKDAWREADRELDRTMSRIRQVADNLTSKMGGAPKEFRAAADELADTLREIAGDTPLAQRREQFLEKIKPGEYVYVRKLNCRAMVLRVQRKRRTMTLTVEGRQMEVGFEQVTEPPTV